MINKKLSILCILKILQEYSDENHPLKLEGIITKLRIVYGLEYERKAVSMNIENLKDFGYDIINIKGKGVFLGERDFEPSEVTFLIDAIFSSHALSSKKAKDLATKVSGFLSNHQKKKFNYVYKTNELTRSNNEQVFFNIDTINDAIEQGKQISFKYNMFGSDGILHARKSGRPYKVNPYFMVNSQGKYYLVCNYDYFNKIANYKIDFISDIKILDTPVKPITKLENYENGIDISKYINENIYMFGGKTITATYKINSEYGVNQVIDWFGKNARVYEKDSCIYAEVKANENALVYWSLQYGGEVELITPADARERVKKEVENLYKKYI